MSYKSKFQNFHGKTLISRDPLPLSMAHFPKMGVFQRSKGRGHEKFTGGKPPNPHFFSLRSHLVSAPPIPISFRRACVNNTRADFLAIAPAPFDNESEVAICVLHANVRIENIRVFKSAALMITCYLRGGGVP